MVHEPRTSMYKLDLEKAKEPEIKLPTSSKKQESSRDQIANIIKKAREFQKNIYICFIDYAKAFDCVDHNKLENSSRDGNSKPYVFLPEKSVCR